MNKIEHIGIAVENVEESNLLFSKLLNTESYKTEEVKSEGVKTSFFRIGDSKIELLEATNQDSSIAKFINKRGVGVHHIAMRVSDIYAEIKRLQNEGFTIIGDGTPKKGADNMLICFMHPKSTNGILIELCQEL